VNWRTVVGAALSVLAGLLAPLAVVAGWAQTLVAGTDAFVASYAPVVRSEPVKQLVTSELSGAIVEQLGLSDNRLAGALVNRLVGEFVAGDTFDAAATASLRVAHSEAVALLTGEPGRLQVTEGEVQLRFAPFVDAVTSRLTDAGVPFLDRLPEVTGGIALWHIDPQLLPILQSGFRALTTVAAWLPWVTFVLVIAAFWIWPGLRGPLLGVGLSLLGWSVAIWVAGRLALQGVQQRIADDFAPVAGLIVGQTVVPILSPLLAIAVLGAVMTFVGAMIARQPATIERIPA